MNPLSAKSKGTVTVVMCSHCQMPYALGVNGTVEGCDECMSVIRNALDGTIISTMYDAVETEDELTDMEKA